MEKLAASGDSSVGGFQHKQRLINVLSKQIEQKQSLSNEKQVDIDKLKEKLKGLTDEFDKVIKIRLHLDN